MDKRSMLVLASILYLIISSNVTANTWVNHTYDETDWTVYMGMSYNGYNICQAYLDVVPLNGETFLDSATESQTDFQLITTLSYGPTNYCNVSFEVYGNLADLNISINYSQHHSGGGYFDGISTIYGPYPDEYSEGEGYYNYDVRSINHANYSSVCGDTFTCIVDVINNTDDSIAYIQVIAGYYDCSIVPPYSFTLLYDGASMHNSNLTFYPLIGGQYRSNLSIPNPIPCSNGYIHSCYIEVYNDTDNSTLYVGNLSAVDDNCPQNSYYRLPNGSFGTLPGLNDTGGISINNGTLKNMPCTGYCIIGLNKEQFQLYAAVMIIITVLISIKPFKLGATASAFALLFFNNIMGWTAITSSLMLIFVFIALAAWFLEGKL